MGIGTVADDNFIGGIFLQCGGGGMSDGEACGAGRGLVHAEKAFHCTGTEKQYAVVMLMYSGRGGTVLIYDVFVYGNVCLAQHGWQFLSPLVTAKEIHFVYASPLYDDVRQFFAIGSGGEYFAAGESGFRLLAGVAGDAAYAGISGRVAMQVLLCQYLHCVYAGEDEWLAADMADVGSQCRVIQWCDADKFLYVDDQALLEGICHEAVIQRPCA